MNTSRSTIDLSQYAKDMSAFTYIANTVNSIRLAGIGQIDNDHGAKILAALCALIQTYKPVKPKTNHDVIKESAEIAMQGALI